MEKAAPKGGVPQNVTLPLPEITERAGQIVNFKFLRFREFYKVKVSDKDVIRVREMKPSKYFDFDFDL